MAGQIARVVLDSPLPQLDHELDYRVPESLAAEAKPGVRVGVPLRGGGRMAQGWIVDLVETSDFSGELALVHSVLSPVPVLSPELYRLARRLADRSVGNVSDVLRLAIPPRHVRAEKAALAEPQQNPELLSGLERRELSGYAPGSAAMVIAPGAKHALSALPRLLESADGAIGQWAANFAELALGTLASGRSVILAVPDYRDQAQLERALAQALPSELVVSLDARQSPAERYRQFVRLRRGGRYVVIGNRSALYAPVSELGVIALWDDSDQAFIEQHAPGVHARDVALMRHELEGVALLFAGLVRSTETERLVELGWLNTLEPVRPVKPRIVLEGDAQRAGLSSAAFAAARAALATGPVLLQVARPGYSTGGMCANCKSPARCTECSGPLFLPNPRRPAQCRVCGGIASAWACPDCAGTLVAPVGAAASRTAEDLGRAFPGVPVVLSDGEREILSVPATPALVIATRGTEPVAEGGYHAAVLLDGARMLAREGLRVSEDALRHWTSAAALAAPDAPVFLPNADGALPRAFATWTLNQWVSAELAQRRALRLPPAVRVASIRGRRELLSEAKAALEAAGVPMSSWELLGPTPVDADEEQYVLRCDYGVAGALARELKAAQIRIATRGRKPVPPGARRKMGLLRVRMDDPEVFA